MMARGEDLMASLGIAAAVTGSANLFESLGGVRKYGSAKKIDARAKQILSEMHAGLLHHPKATDADFEKLEDIRKSYKRGDIKIQDLESVFE